MYFQGDVKAIVAEKDGQMTIKLSPLVGSFNTDILQYMSNLKVIDLSGCTTIKAEDFVSAIVDCKNLMHVVMQSCPQFNEWQFVTIGTFLPKLVDSGFLNRYASVYFS